MIVNYYGIIGCECRFDAQGAFLAAPTNAVPQSLQQLGFYYAQDGVWYKRLTPQETAYLQSLHGAPVADLPAPGAMNGAAAPGADTGETPEEKKAADKLCIISLCLMYGFNILSYIIAQSGSSAFYSISGIATIAAFIMMIVVRVKYPKNKFGKILMIIYLIQLAIGILAFLALMIMCQSCLHDCRGL